MTDRRTRPGTIALRGGRLIDGCGNPWVRADIMVEGGVISEIAPPGRLRSAPGQSVRVIDANDKYVTPGFIDPHTHSDVTILDWPDAEAVLRMGVTTHVTGNCGMSPAPALPDRRGDLLRQLAYYWDVEDLHCEWDTFADYLDAVESRRPGVNIAPLVGHGTLRVVAMGFERRPPTREEMAVMKSLLAESLQGGALGLSSGLVYPPGCYAETVELLELAGVVAEYGGIYASHVRGERETLLDAIAEALHIGQTAGLPIEISHNAPKWGGPSAAVSLRTVEAARERGIDVTVDNDTHTDLAPKLSCALPQPIASLAHDDLVALLSDPEKRTSVRRDIVMDAYPSPGYAGLLRHARFDRIVIVSAPDQGLVGRTLEDIARQRSADCLDTLLDLIVECDDRVVAIFDYIRGKDVEDVFAHPLSMVSSDGFVAPPPGAADGGTDYWPCCYGEYARVLECFVKERGLLRLEEAVRKMTSLPAQRFGLWDRGAIRPGLGADLIVFDLDAIHDRATNEYPHEYPFKNLPARMAEGMDYVLVNGEVAVDGGEMTGARGGRVLRRARVQDDS